MIEWILAFIGCTLVVLMVAIAYKIGRRDGFEESKHYLDAAIAVQAITNASAESFQRALLNDSRTALENLVTVVQALDSRVSIMGQQTEAMRREFVTALRDEPDDRSGEPPRRADGQY